MQIKSTSRWGERETMDSAQDAEMGTAHSREAALVAPSGCYGSMAHSAIGCARVGGEKMGTVAVARMSIESTVRPRRGSGEISARRRTRGSTPLAIPGRWCRGRGRRACLRPRTHPPSRRAPFCRRPCASGRTSPSQPSRLRARRTARSRKTLKSHRQYPTQRPRRLGTAPQHDLARGVLPETGIPK